MREVEKRGLLEGLKIGRNVVEISMLQSANDTMFMCKDNVQNNVTIKSILRIRVNLNKSFIEGIG